MTIRPIDINTVINHMHEVGKSEVERVQKKKLVEMTENKNILQKSDLKKEGINNVKEEDDSTNIINPNSKNAKKFRQGKNKKDNNKEEESDNKKYSDELKGNFIDIKE